MNISLFAGGGLMWQVAGWTMVHFLWIGGLVALGAMASRIALRRAPANVRYGAMLLWLTVLALLPVGIAAWVMRAASDRVVAGAMPSDELRTEAIGVAPVDALTTIELNPQSPNYAGGVAAEVDGANMDRPADMASVSSTPFSMSGFADGPSINDAAPMRTGGVSGTLDEAGNARVAALRSLDRWVSYLPWVWIAGTPLTSLLLVTGVMGAKRLKRASRVIEDGAIGEALVRIKSSLEISRHVGVAVCERIAAPVLVGIVRPMILLPPSALTGWSPDEIEMVLLHELAHVRRWDNLVNLVQRIVESLLFFHPAVWLVSTWVRREREACCDAVVVRHTERPQAYAEMLVALAAQLPRSVLFHPAASSAMAAGPLRSRIRRILFLEDEPMLVSGKSLVVVLGALVVMATLGVLYLPTLGQAEEGSQAQGAAEESTKTDTQDSHESENAEGNEDRGVEEAADDGGKLANKAKYDRAQSTNNLKELMLAMHNYHDTKKQFPAHATYSADGEPLLSWRVHLLPFLGKSEQELYEEFHLDEAWDSPHNVKLVERMPDVFENPASLMAAGATNYLAVVGKNCVMDGSPIGIRLSQITDGTTQTIAIVEANIDQAVEWTRPADLPYQPETPKRGLGAVRPQGWLAALADGSVRLVSNDVDDKTLREDFERDDESGVSGQLEMEGGLFTNEMGAYGPEPASAWQYGAMGMEDGAMSASQAAKRTFPTLEEQKLADLAWKRLGLELESIGPDDLAKVKAQGFEGGVKVTAISRPGQIVNGDVLVGLHVWPTTSLKAVAEVLERDDVRELTPLKFYVVRPGRPIMGGYGSGPEVDTIVTGRIDVAAPFGEFQSSKSRGASPVSSASVIAPTYGGVVPTERPRDVQSPSPTPSLAPTPALAAPTAPAAPEAVEWSQHQGPSSEGAQQLHRYGSWQADMPSVPGAAPVVVDETLTPAPTAQVPTPAPALPPTADPWSAQPTAAAGSDAERSVLQNAPPLWNSGAGAERGASAPDKSALRYDGKSFDEWSRLWRTELSNDKRAEAVHALAAFARAGYGKEAVEVILDVAGEYDFLILQGSSDPEGRLKEAVLDMLTPPYTQRSLAEIWVPELARRLKADPKKWRWLAAHVFGRVTTQDETALAALQELGAEGPQEIRGAALGALVRSARSRPEVNGRIDDATRKLLADVLASDDPSQIAVAVQLLLEGGPSGMSGGMGGGTQATRAPRLIFMPELVPLLFHADEDVQRQARGVLRYVSEEDAPQVVKPLVGVLKNESRSGDQIAAMRALAAIGGRAKEAIPALQEVLKQSDDKEELLAALVAWQNIVARKTGAEALVGFQTKGPNALNFEAFSAEDKKALDQRFDGLHEGIPKMFKAEMKTIFFQ